MIIYRKQPFEFKMKNIIILDAGLTDGYIYVSKDTYEQAVSLAVTFSKDHERIEKALGKTIDGWKITPGIFTAFRKISEGLPEPINMLSTFIAFSTSAGIEWKNDDDEALCETACGVLHTISQFADFYSMTLLTPDQRTKLDIPKHVYKGYKESWDTLIGELDSKVITCSESIFNDLIKKVIERHVDKRIDEKIKDGAVTVSSDAPTPAGIDETQVSGIVDKMIMAKLPEIIENTYKMFLSQTGNEKPMNSALQIPQMPYMMPYGYYPQYPAQPQIPQTMHSMEPAPVVATPVAPTPVASTPVAPTPTLAPAPAPATPAANPIPQAQPIEEDDLPEGAELVSNPDAIAAMFADFYAANEEADKKAAEAPTPEEKPEKDEPKIMTEAIRKEKEIAEESMAIINSYDI